MDTWTHGHNFEPENIAQKTGAKTCTNVQKELKHVKSKTIWKNLHKTARQPRKAAQL